MPVIVGTVTPLAFVLEKLKDSVVGSVDSATVAYVPAV